MLIRKLIILFWTALILGLEGKFQTYRWGIFIFAGFRISRMIVDQTPVV